MFLLELLRKLPATEKITAYNPKSQADDVNLDYTGNEIAIVVQGSVLNDEEKILELFHIPRLYLISKRS